MLTILLLIVSNFFMTAAWYWHLGNTEMPIWRVILVSWVIALFEYCLAMPANRIGFSRYHFSGYQLKVLQEAIALAVFVIYAAARLREMPRLNTVAAFVLIIAAVLVAFYPGQAKAAINAPPTATRQNH
ncbi:DMT family protein [soil metagenome]